jgi:hypothetical protein
MDYSNPNLDFDLEAASLIKALKQAEGMRDARLAPQAQLVNGRAMFGGGPGQMLASGVDNIVGGFHAPQIEQQQRDLASEQQRRMTDLQGQLSAPPTEDPLADNQRRMGIAQQMSRLPQARTMAEQLFKQGTAFPEKMAELKAKQVEAGEKEALRLREKEAADLRHAEMLKTIAANKNATSITIAGMPSRSNIGGGDGGEKPMTAAQSAKQKGSHVKDWTAASQAAEKTYNASSNVDQLLEDPGFDHLFGTTSIVTRQLPQARQAYGKLESLKANLKAAGLESMRAGGSIGAMTEKEWPIVEAMISGLDERMSPAEARSQIKLIQERINRIGRIAGDAYEMQWGDSPYYKAPSSGREPAAPAAPTNGGFKILGVREK